MIDGGDIYIISSYATAYLGLLLYGLSLIYSLRRLRSDEALLSGQKSDSLKENL